MKPLEKTLAMIALVVLTAQIVRHAYILWFETRGSVLDKYDQPLKNEIAGAASLDELLRRYDQVRKEVDEANRQREKAAEPPLPYTRELDSEPFKSERALRDAITGWEEKAKEIRGLRFYSFIGLAFSIIGLFIYKKVNRWYGLTLIIVAFAEIIYWTSPTLLGPTTREFDRLLANKFVFSLIALLLLLVVIGVQDIFDVRRGQIPTAERKDVATAP